MADEKIIVRTRGPLDVPGCISVLEAVFAAGDYPSRWPEDPAAWLNPEGTKAAWVALDARNEEILGHIALCQSPEDPGTVFVTRLFVSPRVRGRGLGAGSQLLLRPLQWAQRAGMELQLDVVESSTPAVGLYERLGWKFLRRESARWIDARGMHPMLRIYAAPQP